MNYFAHGRQFLDDPCLLAGTAVPDWLNVADRGVRAKSVRAATLVHDEDASVAAVARGVVQHHRDDAWFHQSETFLELSWQLTCECRSALPQDEGFRPSFLGHILVELLLDAALIAAEPTQVDRYYLAMKSVDPLGVQTAVNRITVAPTERLALFIDRFCQERFLYDYADNAKLLFRLNQVMRRVQLSPLPESFCSVLESARELVAGRVEDLLRENVAENRRAAG